MGDDNGDDRIVHLAARPGRGACGYVGKFTTMTPASVTCGLCRSTWTFASAQRDARPRKVAATGPGEVLDRVRRDVADAGEPADWQARAEAAEAKLAQRDAELEEAVRERTTAEAKLAAVATRCEQPLSYAITRSTSEAIVPVADILAIISSEEES